MCFWQTVDGQKLSVVIENLCCDNHAIGDQILASRGVGVKRALIQRVKHMLFILGIALLIGTAIVAIAAVGGFIQLPEILIAGESTVHSIARFAIVGCLLAAIGSLE